MKLKDAIHIGIKTLEALPELDKNEIQSNVYFLLSSLLNKSIGEIKLKSDELFLSPQEYKLFLSYIDRRLKLEPVQYITGETDFWSLNFKVCPGVLIPRQDTETLVEAIVKDYKNNQNSKINFLDICCGSGCIGISVLSELTNSHCTFTDISQKAIECTTQNLVINNLDQKATVIKSDLFTELTQYQQDQKKFSFIVSNPPYIPAYELRKLQLDITLYEPEVALNGGENGIKFYKELAKIAPNYLLNQGKIYVECGYNIADKVIEVFKQNNWKQIELIKDLNNINRLITAIKP